MTLEDLIVELTAIREKLLALRSNVPEYASGSIVEEIWEARAHCHNAIAHAKWDQQTLLQHLA